MNGSHERSRTGLVILLSSLVLSLVLSVLALLKLKAETRVQQDAWSRDMDRCQVAISQRDSLAAVNRALLSREDSMGVLRYRAESLQARLTETELRNTYPGYYLVIDTQENRFQLRRGDLLVRTGYCGTGKGWTESDSGLVWDFSTPRGRRSVVTKKDNPYWYRPDWYWLEQGLRPPEPENAVVIPDSLSYTEQIVYYHDSLTARERVWVQKVPGALGSYLIDLDEGILVHSGVGLGSNVSHGCIRMGTRDLSILYRVLPVGAPVVIY